MHENNPYIVVLGMAQDGGVPHAGTKKHKGWENLRFKRLAACLGVIDPESSQRWMVEATPDFRDQLYRLDKIFPVDRRPGLDGIYITHAHIGHYTGLMFLGRESMGSRELPVYAMPRLLNFFVSNGPWDQLVRLNNIVLNPLHDGIPVQLNERLSIIPFIVPHRQEYSEVAGFRIQGPNRSVLFIPDIDKWETWDEQGTRIESIVNDVDTAYVDGTFYTAEEIPGRTISTIPHPPITHTMMRFSNYPPEIRSRIRFIHLNHTNPALWSESEARKGIEKKGFHVTEELERFDL